MITSRNLLTNAITVCTSCFRVVVSESDVQMFDTTGNFLRRWRAPEPAERPKSHRAEAHYEEEES